MSAINNSVSKLCENIAQNSVNGGVTYSKDELQTLFEDTGYFNAGEKGKEQIQKQIDALQAKIDELTEEAEKINKEIEEKNYEVNGKNEDLVEIISQISDETMEYQQGVKDAARLAARDAVASYNTDSGDSYESCYNQAFEKRIRSVAGGNMGTIKNLYAQYEGIKGQLSPVMQEIQTDLDQVKGLQNQLNSTNATINLLTITKNNMSDTIKAAYENKDLDAKVPVYSGAKAEVADEILADAAAFVGNAGDTPNPDNNNAVQERTPEQQKQIDDAMAAYAAKNEGTGYNATWYATIDKNPQLQNLSERINNEGMLQDLQNLGATPDEIMTFVMNTWNCGIKRSVQGDGTISYVIPNNSGSDEAVYSKLNALATSGVQKTAESVDSGNIEKLQQFGLSSLDKMYKAGFTFKEAMYVMTKAFPNSGIEYNLSNQTSERNYQIVQDTSATGTLYKDISAKILDYWNVGAKAATEDGDGTIETSRGHYDPITFQDGNITYSFITDRDNNGKFDYTDGNNNDLLGSKDGISELLAYDYNNDGIIDSKDVDKDGTKALDKLTLISNNQIESVGELGSEDVDGYKDGSNYKGKGAYTNSVDFDVSYTSASQAGITNIDLRQIKESGNINGEDNVDEGFSDINGSNIINQFTITKDGEEITANETLNTAENLETFYGQIADKAGTISSNISSEQFENAFDDWSLSGPEAKAAYEKLGALADSLEDKLEDAKANEDNDILPMSFEQFIELVGTDGQSGEYVYAVRDAARRNSEAEAERNNPTEAANKAEEAHEQVTKEYFDNKNVDEKENDKEEKKEDK